MGVRNLSPQFNRLHNQIRLTGGNTGMLAESMVRMGMLTGDGNDLIGANSERLMLLANSNGILADKLVQHAASFVDSTQKLKLQIGAEAYAKVSKGFDILAAQMPGATKEINAFFTAISDEKKRIVIGAALGIEDELKKMLSGNLTPEEVAELFKQIVPQMEERVADLLPEATGDVFSGIVRGRMDEALVGGTGALIQSIVSAIEGIDPNEVKGTFDSKIRKVLNIMEQNIINPLKEMGAEWLDAVLENKDQFAALIDDNIMSVIRNLFNQFMGAWKNTDFPALFETIGTVFSGISTLGLDLINIIKNVVGAEGEGLNGFADAIKKVLGFVLDFGGRLITIIPEVANVIILLGDVIVNAIHAIIETLDFFALGLIPDFTEDITEGWRKVSNASKEFVNGFADGVEVMGNEISKTGQILRGTRDATGPTPKIGSGVVAAEADFQRLFADIGQDNKVTKAEFAQMTLLLEEMRALQAQGKADADKRVDLLEQQIEAFEPITEVRTSLRKTEGILESMWEATRHGARSIAPRMF